MLKENVKADLVPQREADNIKPNEIIILRFSVNISNSYVCVQIYE